MLNKEKYRDICFQAIFDENIEEICKDCGLTTSLRLCEGSNCRTAIELFLEKEID